MGIDECFFIVSGAAIVASSPVGVGGGIVGGGQALVGFHEDALSQAAVGRAQLLLTLVLGLALAADCSELVVLGFVLPAAELQLCIGSHRKNWLGKNKTILGTEPEIKACLHLYYANTSSFRNNSSLQFRIAVWRDSINTSGTTPAPLFYYPAIKLNDCQYLRHRFRAVIE